MSYSSSVLAVKMNRKTLVVVIETAIYIYDITNMHLLHTISGTPPNLHGICALASCHVPGDPRGAGTNNFFAYPGNTDSGEVFVYDVTNLRHVNSIPAHTSAVSCLAFSHAGDRLATSSQKGTVIRVFSCPDGVRLFEFRRGIKTYASISSLSFNFDASFLCATSDKATVHIFKFDQAAAAPASAPAPEPAAPAASSWTSYLTGKMSDVASFLPPAVTDMFTQTRSFAQVTVPEGLQVIGCLVGDVRATTVVLVTSLGFLLKYRIDCDKGGEAVEVARHSLLASYGVDVADDRAEAADTS